MYKIFTLTDEQIQKQSVLKLETQDQLLSSQLGSIDKQIQCETCKNVFPKCNGHQGYIQSFWYYLPILQEPISNMLQKTCVNCLHYQSQKYPQCQYCANKFESFYIINNNRALLYITVKNTQLINLLQLLQIKQQIQNIDDDIYLHPLFIQKILEYMITLKQNLPIQSSALLNFVHQYIPVVSQQFRVSQPELGELNFMNTMYQKIFTYQIILTKIQSQTQTNKNIYLQLIENQKYVINKYYTVIYLLMGSTSDQNLQEYLGLKSTNNLFSLMSRSTQKKGFFRNNMNGVRVDKSARTVVTGNPLIKCDELVCPQYIAEQITIGIHVNIQNYSEIIKLILNYPKYPCVMYYIPQKCQDKQAQYIKIKNDTKEIISQQIVPGDIVFRQVLQYETCLTNRYPSLAEESFGCHKLLIRDEKSIQFNESVIEKMAADFDGDEMQLYFPYNQRDNTENIILQSIYRQFITYEGGLNIIGGAKDLKLGIFNLQQYFSKYEDKLNKLIPTKLKEYNDGNIVIQKGKFIKIHEDLASDNSQFLTQLSKVYGQYTAVSMIDNILALCYEVNEICGSTLYTNIFDIDTKSIYKYTKQQHEEQIKLIDEFYNNKFISPLGVDKRLYFEQYIITLQSFNTFIQLDILLQQLKVQDQNYKSKEQYYNIALEKQFSDQMRACCINVGQKKNSDGTRITNPIRVCQAFTKFDFTPETQGYIYGCFAKGITQTETYFENIDGRFQLYKKTNATPDVGYVSRRLAKGLDNIYMWYDGIVKNGDRILSLGYGAGNYDPRYYTKFSLKNIFKLTEEELKKEYSKQAIEFIEDLKQLYQKSLPYPECEIEPQIVIPFNWYESITQKDLDQILVYGCCEKQTKQLQQAIIFRNLNFYIYLLLFCKISQSKNITEIQEIFQRAQCPHGDPLGAKAALALGRPITQLVLKAIHNKGGNGIQNIILDELKGNNRLKSLIDKTKAPTVFSCKLFNKEKTLEFINKYQTIQFKDFEPKYNYYLQNNQYYLEITINIQKLVYYNIQIQNLLDQIPFKYISFDIYPSKDKTDIIISYVFQNDNIEDIKYVKHNFILGSNFLYNLYYSKERIYGNVSNIQKLYQIPDIDPDTIYISEPDVDIFGIFYTRNKLYQEFYKCMDNTGMKDIERSHSYLMAQQLTISGQYEAFSRNSYKHDDNRSLIQNIIYEQGGYFIQQQLLKDIQNTTTDFVSAQSFGTMSNYGTNISRCVLEIK